MMRWIPPATIALLIVLLLGLQYRLWWGEGGRLELLQLRQQSEEYDRENRLLNERNAKLTRQVRDLKAGQTVLEQHAREELGLTREDEVFYQFVDPQEMPSIDTGDRDKSSGDSQHSGTPR
ncbi:MAG: septum formation initiator family protein [Congregibacter sp.]